MTDAEAEDEERRLVCQRCQHKIFAVDSLSVPQLHFLVTTLRPKQQQQLAEAQPQPQPQSSASALSPSDTPGAPLGSSDTTSASGGESTDELGHSEPAAGSVSSSLDDSLAGSSSDQVPEPQQPAQPQQPSLDDSGSYPPPSLRTSPLDDATVPVKPQAVSRVANGSASATASPAPFPQSVAASTAVMLAQLQSPRARFDGGSMDSYTPARYGDLTTASEDASDDLRLFLYRELCEVSSDMIGVDLPLCRECTRQVESQLIRDVSETQRELERYQSFVQQLEEQGLHTDSALVAEKQMQLEIASLQQQEREFRDELAELEREREILRQQTKQMAFDGARLQLIEERYWLNFNEFEGQLAEFCDTREALLARTEHMRQHLEKLKHTNPYNDTFHIWHDGHYGTINGLRLGRLHIQAQVDWNENNAAWGQTTLLLYTLAKRLNFEFVHYKLIPYGSHSKIERVDTHTVHELFGSSELTFGTLFRYRKFDDAMTAFLRCLKELTDFVEMQGAKSQMPYRLESNRIGELPFTQDWTKTLKHMLTNMKYLLAYTSKPSMAGGSSSATTTTTSQRS